MPSYELSRLHKNMSEFIINGHFSFLTFLYVFELALLVIILNYKDKRTEHYILIVTILAFMLWSFTNSLFLVTGDLNTLTILGRLAFLATSIFTLMLFILTLNLVGRWHKLSNLKKSFVFALPSFFILTSWTPLVYENAYTPASGNMPGSEYGPLYTIFIAHIAVYFGVIFYILIKDRKKLQPIRRLQIDYFLFGLIIAFAIGFTTNAILPMLFQNWNLSAFGPFGSAIFLSFVTYAMVRHKLLGIEIILRKSLIYTLSLGVSIGFISWVLLRYQAVFQDDIETLGPWFTIIVVVAFAIIYPILQWAIKKFVDRLIFSDTLNLFEKFNKKQYLLHQSPELRGFSEKTIQSAMSFFHSSCEFLIWNEEEKNYKQYYESSRLIVLLSNDPILQILERFKRHIYTEDIEKFASQEGLEREVIKSCTKRLKQLDVQILMPLVIHDRILAIVLVGRSEYELTDREISQLAMQFSQRLSYTLMVNYQFKPLQQ